MRNKRSDIFENIEEMVVKATQRELLGIQKQGIVHKKDNYPEFPVVENGNNKMETVVNPLDACAILAKHWRKFKEMLPDEYRK
jgi:hypothetical protein